MNNVQQTIMSRHKYNRRSHLATKTSQQREKKTQNRWFQVLKKNLFFSQIC